MTDIKLSKAQLSKIIQLGGFQAKTLGNVIGNLDEKVLIDLAKDALPKLATKATSSLLDNFERNTSGKGAVRARKGFTLFILNEDIDDIINQTVEK